MAEVAGFFGPYRFLSNFYVEPDGTHVEGEYQAQKCASHADLSRFSGLSPLQAKQLGRHVPIRPDWNKVKIETMRALVWQKFVDHPELAARLLATEDAELVEENHWKDTFWGRYRGVGQNWLGRILMETREALKREGKNA